LMMTLSEAGSLGWDGNSEYRVPTTPVPSVVDATGAGDSFAAAFVHSYLQGRDFRQSLEKANAYARNVIQKIGAY